MRFPSYQVKGRGRARTLGFPTINLKLPELVEMDYGIYGAFLYVDGKKYLGALHYGQSPTFEDDVTSCEIYLIGKKNEEIPDTEGKRMEVEILKRIRDVKKFENSDILIKQIDQDIEEIRNLAAESS